MTYQVRKMSRKDLDTAVSWAADEGWNPGIYDAEAFFATDPNGFFMGFLDGEPVSSLTAVSYPNKFGFLGFYIVKPGHRGKGYGWSIWQEAVKYLRGHNIGLDGVVAQQENYQKSGFRPAYRNIRYEGTGGGRAKKPEKIISLSEVPFEMVTDYDRKVFPAPRTAFLNLWFVQPESLALGYVDKGKLMGYGMIRKCRTGYKVGPLFADTPGIADQLLEQFMAFAGNDKIYLDVPEKNPEAVKLAGKYRMKPMFETARMYTKKAPQVHLSKIYGVTTFELG